MKQRIKRKRIYRKKSVSASQRTDLPGYPYYPETEDITSRETRARLDIEKFPERVPVTKTAISEAENPGATEKVPKKESDLTKDDLAALGPKDANMDMGDDEIMNLSGDRYDRTGDDLDVPGTELDDENEKIGEEDEENNYYSLGGDKEENSDNSP